MKYKRLTESKDEKEREYWLYAYGARKDTTDADKQREADRERKYYSDTKTRVISRHDGFNVKPSPTVGKVNHRVDSRHYDTSEYMRTAIAPEKYGAKYMGGRPGYSAPDMQDVLKFFATKFVKHI